MYLENQNWQHFTHKMAFSIDYFENRQRHKYLPKEYSSYEEWLGVYQLVNYCIHIPNRIITQNNEVSNLQCVPTSYCGENLKSRQN